MSVGDSGPKQDPEPEIEYESIKTRINGEIPKEVLAEFVRHVLRCPVCAAPLDLKPLIEAAVTGSLEEMIREKNVEPKPAMLGLLVCIPCKQRGGSTVIPIQN